MACVDTVSDGSIQGAHLAIVLAWVAARTAWKLPARGVARYQKHAHPAREAGSVHERVVRSRSSELSVLRQEPVMGSYLHLGTRMGCAMSCTGKAGGCLGQGPSAQRGDSGCHDQAQQPWRAAAHS